MAPGLRALDSSLQLVYRRSAAGCTLGCGGGADRILYEHPQWFEPLFAELDRRAVGYEQLHARELVFDPGEPESPYSVVFS